MKTESQNAAIAEACGKQQLYAVRKGDLYYRPFAIGYTSNIQHAWHTTKQSAEYELVSGLDMDIVPVPAQNYTGDLNSMHEAEKWLLKHSQNQPTDRVWAEYSARLDDVGICIKVHATAAQRSEAFLRTIGKWVEE